MNAPGFALNVAGALLQRVAVIGWAVTDQVGGANANRLQRLSQFIVQFACQFGLLLFAHCQQPAAELELALAGGVQFG